MRCRSLWSVVNRIEEEKKYGISRRIELRAKSREKWMQRRNCTLHHGECGVARKQREPRAAARYIYNVESTVISATSSPVTIVGHFRCTGNVNANSDWKSQLKIRLWCDSNTVRFVWATNCSGFGSQTENRIAFDEHTKCTDEANVIAIECVLVIKRLAIGASTQCTQQRVGTMGRCEPRPKEGH